MEGADHNEGTKPVIHNFRFNNFNLQVNIIIENVNGMQHLPEPKIQQCQKRQNLCLQEAKIKRHLWARNHSPNQTRANNVMADITLSQEQLYENQ